MRQRTVFFILWFFMLGQASVYGAVSIIDATGETVEFKTPPARIISLNPTATETLYAMGSGSEIVGVTVYCSFPDDAMRKEKIGTVLEPDIERIISLGPDLVLATVEGNPRQTVERLRRSGIKVFVFGEVRSFADIFARINTLGSILQKESAAKAIIGGMRETIADVRGRVRAKERPKVFVQLGYDPIVTANRDTPLGEMLDIIGAVNIAADAGLRYPPYSLEEVAEQNPDVIIVVSMGQDEDMVYKRLRSLKSVNAVRNNRIYAVDSDIICNLSPRIMEGLKKTAGMLHPDIFMDEKEKP